MKDKLQDVIFYQKSVVLWDACWNDTGKMLLDFRGKEIARQLIRAVGSISANIEEGYGRGFGKEYPHFLRIARGSARESKGWYQRSVKIIEKEIVDERMNLLDEIIAMITKSIQTLESKN